MKSRVITAIIILGVLLPIIYLSSLMFKIAALVIVAIAVHELLDVKKEKKYSIVTKGIVYLVNLMPLILIDDFGQLSVAYVAIPMVVICLLMFIDKNVDFDDIGYLLIVSLFIIMASNGALYLRNLDHGFSIVIFTILVTAASDTGAFFTGNAIGKHKLISRISPNKTIEGLLGGIILAGLVGIVYDLFLPTGFDNQMVVVAVSLTLGFTAALGDLFFSAIKRANEVKDFSNMLPGHGGILDRVDSHLMNLIVCFVIFVVLKG